MLARLRNVFGKSPQTNPYQTLAGSEAGSLVNTRPLGLINGLVDGFEAWWSVQAANWVKTLNTGTVTTTDGHPAVLTIVTNNVADAVTSLQLSKDAGTTAWALFTMSTTDGLWIFGRLKISDATNSAILFGLANAATANIFGTSGSSGAIGAGITNFVGFHKPNGSATLNAVVRKASTSTSQTLTGYALADDTYIRLTILIPNSTSGVQFWVNGVLAYTQSTLTNLPLTTTALTPTIAAQTPAAAAKTLTVHRVMGMQEVA